MDKNPSMRQVLVLVNHYADSRSAVVWAAHWALRTQDAVTLLHIIEPAPIMHFGAMQNIMLQEQQQEATRELDLLAGEVERITGNRPRTLLRDGVLKETVREVLAEEKNLSMVVTAAHHREAGPAPLIAYLTSRMGSRVQVPFVLIPEDLTNDRISALT